MRERDADPRDAEQRHRDGRSPAPRLEQDEQEGHRHTDRQHEQHLLPVAERGGGEQSDQDHEPCEPRGMGLRVHGVELVQADQPETGQEDGERRTADDHEEERQRDGRHPDQNPLAEVGAHPL